MWIIKDKNMFSKKFHIAFCFLACISLTLILAGTAFCKEGEEALADTFENAVASCGKLSFGSLLAVNKNQLVIDDANFKTSANLKVYSTQNQRTSLSALRSGLKLQFAINPKGLICAIKIGSQSSQAAGIDNDENSRNKSVPKTIKKINGKWTNTMPSGDTK